jgi:hypothetical protein
VLCENSIRMSRFEREAKLLASLGPSGFHPQEAIRELKNLQTTSDSKENTMR